MKPEVDVLLHEVVARIFLLFGHQEVLLVLGRIRTIEFVEALEIFHDHKAAGLADVEIVLNLVKIKLKL